MLSHINLSHSISDAWAVLVLFLIPIGGGIPAGVLLARSRGFDWPVMMGLYFVSDVILACTFEPVLRMAIKAGKDVPFVKRLSVAFKMVVQKSTSLYGNNAGPLALIMITFGSDPMTGRAATLAAGHGFLMGWLFTITGDMLYFTLIMVSTIWLNNILGDGTWTMLIILAFMILLPLIVRRIRKPKSTS